MVQAVDGNWYGYFGDSTAVPAADIAANNLNFGTNGAPTVLSGDFAEALGGVYAYTLMQTTNQADGVLKNVPLMSAWNGTTTVGEAMPRTSDKNVTQGQIGIQDSNQWPFIQLYDLTIENFDVVLEQAGADEVVSLNYDSGDLDDFASLTLDRSSASQGSDIHLVITDNQLNIDPTAEDIVMFNAYNDNVVSFTNSTLANTVAGEGYVQADYLPLEQYF